MPPASHESRGRAGRLPSFVASAVVPVLALVGVVAVAGTTYVLTNGSEPDAPSSNGTPVAAAGDVPSDPPDDLPGELADLLVRDGDSVQSTGTVVDADGLPRLCATAPMAAVYRAPGDELAPTCSGLAVHLTGIDDIELPGWTERQGTWFTWDQVVLTGTWTAGSLAVSAARVAEEADLPQLDWDAEPPCDPPPGGWLLGDYGLPTDDPESWERMVSALVEEVEAQPERFHDRRVAYPGGDPFAPGAPTNDMGEPVFDRTVLVVSTVDDPATVEAELRPLFPGNLCIEQVDHSRSELEAVVQRLTVDGGSWVLEAFSLEAGSDNRVQLELPVLDKAAAERIGADATLVEVHPLVRRA